MNEFSKKLLNIMGYVFALLVVSFTAVQSWSLLYEVSGNAWIATLGVVLFEGGMIYWWFAFQKDAEGLGQMAVSMLGAIFGLILVGGATALHLGAIDADTFGAATPARLITMAAVVNLVLKFTYPLLHPDIMHDTLARAAEGKIMLRAYKGLEQRADEVAEAWANDMVAAWEDKMQVRLYGKHHVSLPRPQVIDGEAQPVPPPTPSQAKEQQDREVARGFEDFLADQPPITQRGIDRNLQAYPYAGHRRNGNQPPE